MASPYAPIQAKHRQEHPSKLVTEETTVRFADTPTYGAVLRRSCRSEVLAAKQVYSRLDSSIGHDKSYELEHCRSLAWFVRHDVSGEVRVATSSCKLRWCPVCANSRRNFIAHEVAEWLDGSDHPKFLTFTLKHSNSPLEHQVKGLYQFFRKLRLRKEFARCVTGGIWFFHIKKSKADGLWHPHLHCLVTGLYLPKRHLQHLWLQLTYTSTVVGIRAVHDYEHAAFEAARYAASPGSLVGLDLEDAVELVECMHGKRICGTWGTARSMSLRPEPQYDRHLWNNVGDFRAVTATCKTDHNAQAILLAWQTKQPLPDGISLNCAEEVEINLDRLFGEGWDVEAVEEQERSPP